ncbi:hypothetical protein GCM10010172_72800 [Paractinoplanes ferrugineus]|uniref:DUF3885 domain-containing protein n=1 Tax=Paractinoplanes ferrugineus TaxID=113564 RepID=A0A919MGF5_9ACTN|nr:hypothetical protein [Actinoplanes ferrugineus]GIE11565.1 hypothetical protein Afe05nite_34050 [Actinoplanes ferrugineus]
MIADGVVDTVALSMLWDARWPGCAKLPYAIRAVGDRWIRFHTLPGSKRYPESDAEYEMVLARYNIVLGELVTGATVLVATAGYSDSSQPSEPSRSPETLAVHPHAVYWTSACIDDEPGSASWLHLYVSRLTWSAGCLDPLLRRVADDVIANVLVADTDLRWLYHPYDGGMDVMLSCTAERDALRDRHQDWLSKHPGGL